MDFITIIMNKNLQKPT